MSAPVPFERWEIRVPKADLLEAAAALCEMGVSIRWWSDGRLTALIRHGSDGAADRLAIVQVELRLSENTLELVQWLNMCWQLPQYQKA